MVTGRKAFQGGTQASVMAKILETDPALRSAVAAVSPPQLDHIVMRCLAKEPEDRWQSARDVLLELRWVQGGGAEVRADPVHGRARRAWIPWAVTVAVVAAAIAWIARQPATDAHRPVVRFEASLAPNMSLEDWRGWPTLSPDGRLIVVTGTLDGRQQLLVRRLEEASFRALPGTEGARRPFLSPFRAIPRVRREPQTAAGGSQRRARCGPQRGRCGDGRRVEPETA